MWGRHQGDDEMKRGPERKSRKRGVILAAVVIAVLGLAGARRMAVVSQANSDRSALRQQRAARGMPDPEQVRAQMQEDMARSLGLTEPQKRAMKAAMEEGPDPHAIFQDRSLSQDQRFERMREIGQAREARIRSILTPDQVAKYQEMQRQRAERWRERSRNRPESTGNPAGSRSRDKV